MQPSSGVAPSGQGLEGQTWNILDQVYIPKHVSDHSFSWHAMLPAGSFVPTHVHPTQDEFVFLLEGRMEFVLDGKPLKAGPGDLVSLPMGIPHSIHNRSANPVTSLFWVTPTRMLYDYFKKINGVQNKALLAELAAKHEVPFV